MHRWTEVQQETDTLIGNKDLYKVVRVAKLLNYPYGSEYKYFISICFANVLNPLCKRGSKIRREKQKTASWPARGTEVGIDCQWQEVSLWREVLHVQINLNGKAKC